MDVTVPQRLPERPTVQSPLANFRNPQSLARLWQMQKPLHKAAFDLQTVAGNLTARMQKMDKPTAIQPRDMFPFRIFNPPPQFQASPNWQDSFGSANWRTFQVWTGMAPAWLIQDPGDGAPAGAQVAFPQLVYVARTSGYNNSGLTNGSNQAIANVSIIGENYNEYYSAQVLGNYPANPMNGPSNTGPANYPQLFNELCFTANPCSICVFWISWDTNTNDSGVPIYSFALDEENYVSFPVLHFGGVDVNNNWFGDLNSTNGPAILGLLASDFAGTPSQLFPFFPANAFNTPLEDGSQTPEGTVIIGAIQVGQRGAAANTGNDGMLQIFQCQFDNLLTPMQRQLFRGRFNGSNFYFPNEVLLENDTNNCNGVTMYLQVTPIALQGVDPQEGLSNQPYSLGTNYQNTSFETGNDAAGWKNLYMPVGGQSQCLNVSINGVYQNCYFLLTQPVNILNAPT